MRCRTLRHALAIGLLAVTACAPAQTAPSTTAPLTLTVPPTCTPTRADVPANYKADAPVRNKIGAGGYVIEGIVMRIDCTPVPEARIEFWHVNADGNYDDDHRATFTITSYLRAATIERDWCVPAPASVNSSSGPPDGVGASMS